MAEDGPGLHPFMHWLLVNSASVNTIITNFARQYAIVLPVEGEPDELRAALLSHLKAEGADRAHISWEMSVFDVAWDMYQPPCAFRGCSALAIADSTLCQAHTLRELL